MHYAVRKLSIRRQRNKVELTLLIATSHRQARAPYQCVDVLRHLRSKLTLNACNLEQCCSGDQRSLASNTRRSTRRNLRCAALLCVSLLSALHRRCGSAQACVEHGIHTAIQQMLCLRVVACPHALLYTLESVLDQRTITAFIGYILTVMQGPLLCTQ